MLRGPIRWLMPPYWKPGRRPAPGPRRAGRARRRARAAPGRRAPGRSGRARAASEAGAQDPPAGRRRIRSLRQDGRPGGAAGRQAGRLAPAPEAQPGRSALGARRSALGARRSALGARRSALGARRSALGARRSALGARRSALGARRSALGARRSALGARRSALGARRSALGARRSALGARRSALGARRSALGARRSALGARRSALGARHCTASRCDVRQAGAIVQCQPLVAAATDDHTFSPPHIVQSCCRRTAAFMDSVRDSKPGTLARFQPFRQSHDRAVFPCDISIIPRPYLYLAVSRPWPVA